MLKDDLYTMREWRVTGSTLSATLLLNPEHPIFQGHFPGQPVVPGACLLQMVKEMMEVATDTPLQLVRAPAMKFLLPLSPTDTPAVELSWKESDSLFDVKAVFTKDATPCFRFNGSFRIPA